MTATSPVLLPFQPFHSTDSDTHTDVFFNNNNNNNNSNPTVDTYSFDQLNMVWISLPVTKFL